MNAAIRKTSYRNHLIEIHQDESLENPIKEWDVLGKVICWHRRYDLGNCTDFADPKEVGEYAKRTGSLLFPLYMYDHGGVVLSLSDCRYPFNDRWDAGQLGYVLVDRQQALKELGKKRMTHRLRKRITGIIQAEVDTYNLYLSGDIYGYVVCKNGEEIDSCWGFYGIDAVEEEARSVVDYQIGQTIKTHCQRLKQWIRNNVPLVYRSACITG